MNRFILSLLVAAAFSTGLVHAQDDDGGQQAATPTLEETAETVNGLNDRTTMLETELEKLKMIKISGYIQAEWQHFDQNTNPGGRAFFSDSRRNLFTIRRGRVKFQHKLGTQMSYVLQADVTERGVGLKDAYGQYTVMPNDELFVQVGAFNRPNYEVEFSSSARESSERSQIVRAFYPDERDLGFMFTYNPPIADDFNPKLQVGLFNGGGIVTNETDAYKDLIARLMFPLPLGSESPVQVDLGASIYQGGIPQLGDSITKWESEARKTVVNDATGNMKGWGNRANFNVEGQIYLDILPFGGTILRGEFLAGKRPTAATAAGASSVGVVKGSAGQDSVVAIKGASAANLAIRNQSGFYGYFVQNIGSQLQLALKYDVFDRNTDLSGANVKSSGDAKSSVLGFGVNYFIDNLRITAWYEMPKYETDEISTLEDLKDNKTTIRFQYKF